MWYRYRSFACMAIVLAVSGCSTSARFIIPQDSELIVYNREVAQTNAPVKMRPFFWNAAGGVKYRLYQHGSLVKEGKLKTRFRPVSIFWPPYALIYWPMGFGGRCYDLTTASNQKFVEAGCLEHEMTP